MDLKVELNKVIAYLLWESSSKLNTTKQQKTVLQKAHKKYLESITSLMFIDSLRLLFIHMFSMKKGITPEIAHSTPTYSNMFEYWTFSKVSSFCLFKLHLTFSYYFSNDFINRWPFIYRSSISKLFRMVFNEEVIYCFNFY